MLFDLEYIQGVVTFSDKKKENRVQLQYELVITTIRNLLHYEPFFLYRLIAAIAYCMVDIIYVYFTTRIEASDYISQHIKFNS